jgi:hypothetical protein
MNSIGCGVNFASTIQPNHFGNIDDKLQKGLQMIVHQLKHLEGIAKMVFVYSKLDFLELHFCPSLL